MGKYNRDLRGLVREFVAEKGDGVPFTRSDVARWALATARIQRPAGYAENLVARQLAKEFGEAMREDYATDRQGRTVRAFHAARVGGQTRWNSREKASREFLETSFMQRREQVVGDCRHLKTDVDSCNENLFPDRPIQMVFDFSTDLAELEAAAAAQRKAS
jgi:hypothetical protein